MLILLSFIIKRIFFGGFSKLIYIIISLILSIIASILNIIFIILDFILILFTFFSIISNEKNNYYKNIYNNNDDDINVELKFYIQLIINIIIFVYNIKLLIASIKFVLDVNKLRKGMVKLNKSEDNIDENEPNFKPVEFKYISLEGNIYSIKEVRNNLLQRYLYYSLDNPSDSEMNEMRDYNDINELSTQQFLKNKFKNRELNEKFGDKEEESSTSSNKRIK